MRLRQHRWLNFIGEIHVYSVYWKQTRLETNVGYYNLSRQQSQVIDLQHPAIGGFYEALASTSLDKSAARTSVAEISLLFMVKNEVQMLFSTYEGTASIILAIDQEAPTVQAPQTAPVQLVRVSRRAKDAAASTV